MYSKPNLKKGTGPVFPSQLLLTMKLTALLITWAFLQVNAESFAQTVSLRLEHAPLKEVIRSIQKQTGYAFVLYDRDLKNTKPVDIALQKVSLEEALQAALRGQPLSFTITEDRVVVLKKQEKFLLQDTVIQVLSGTVTDSTQLALPGVIVAVKNRNQVTSTNTNGRYELKNVGSSDTLVFSSLGYRQTEVRVNGQKNIDVILQTFLNELNSVVVVGYGTQRQSQVTASISTVKAADIANRPVPNVLNALQGQVAGVFVQQFDGRPGTNNIKFNIRGTSTLSNNPALILVDGVPGRMEALNPNDIDNISVLKDAAATAIYGARASGGVVLVTTKKGARGSKTTLSYDGYVGFQNPTYLPKMVDASTYMTKWNESMLNDNPAAQVRFSPEEIARYASGELLSTDWVDAIFDKNALQSQHNLSVSGGTENTDYFVSLGYLDQDGSVEGVRNQRYSTRVKLNTRIMDNLTVGINTQYTNSPRNYPGPNNTYFTAMSWAYILAPTEWPYTPQGKLRHYRGGSQPLAILREGGFETFNEDNIITNLHVDYEVIKNLHLKGQYAYNTRRAGRKNFWATYQLYDDDENLVTTQQQPNRLQDDNTTEVNQSFIATANYDLNIRDHALKFLAGFNRESSRLEQTVADRQEFLNNDLPYLNGGSNNKDLWTTGGSASHWAIQSWFGRMNYAWKERYLLEVNARYDGSSRFLNDRWGFFPSVSAGWRISEESFLKAMPAISNLKLRGSYGKVGNQYATGLYPWASVIGTGAYYFGDKAYTTTYYSNSPNPDLTWEEKTTLDIGMDAGFFKEKLTFTADVYRELTTGMLRSPSVASTFGRGAPVQNVGKMENRGWELSVGYQDYDNAFKYGFRVNLYNNKNKILDLGGTPESIGVNPIMIGQGQWVWYGYASDGLYQSEEDVASSPVYKPQNRPGDIKYKDQNGDGRITPEDRVLLGDAYPHYMFGISMNFAYKGFDLSILTQGVLKNKTYLNGYVVNPFNYGGSFTQDLLDSWTPDNRDARYPVMRQDQSVNNEFSDWWLFDSRYLRVKNLQLGYTFTEKLLKPVKLSRLRVYCSMDNLLTWKAKNFPTSYDPEIDNWEQGTYFPQMQTITFGANLTF